MIHFRRRHAGSFGFSQGRTLRQCSAARRAPVGIVSLGQHGVAMRTDTLHGPSVPKSGCPTFAMELYLWLRWERSTHTVDMMVRAISVAHSRMAVQSRISSAGILFSGLPGIRRIRLKGNGRLLVLHRPANTCNSATLSHG